MIFRLEAPRTNYLNVSFTSWSTCSAILAIYCPNFSRAGAAMRLHACMHHIYMYTQRANKQTKHTSFSYIQAGTWMNSKGLTCHTVDQQPGIRAMKQHPLPGREAHRQDSKPKAERREQQRRAPMGRPDIISSTLDTWKLRPKRIRLLTCCARGVCTVCFTI